MLLSAMVAMAGCGSTKVAGPDYKRPEVAVKPEWSQLEGRQLNPSEVIAADWWTGFGDPYLNDLIDRALGDGLDLKIAALRLEKAGIQLSKDRFVAKPRLAAAPADSIARQRQDGGKSTTARDTEMLGVGLSWEIDIWGKIAKDLQVADARYRGNEMDFRATYLALVANVAERYFQIHQYDEQIAQQVASQQQAENLLQIYQAQFGEGMIPETQLRSQKAEISSLANRLLDLKRGRTESELKLATLIGVPAGDLKVPVASLRQSVHLLELPAVMPADIMSRRPDVLKAEYGVLQAHHLVGKARLARLPTFSLSAVAKTGASLTSTLINSWSFGLATSFAGMFDRDLKIDVDISNADASIAAEEYRRTVLQAFEEVEVALLNLDTRQRQMQQLEAQIADLQIVRNVQDARLREGLISQLEVFDTERTLLSAQQEMLTTYQQLLTDTVTLYKAVGGGWPVEQVGSATRPVVSKK
jgi:NodT family efflux transporter outer membrane factor (OMF) lipoprotein